MEEASLAIMTLQKHHTEVGVFPINYMEAGQGNPVVIPDAVIWEISKPRDALAQRYRVVALHLPGFGSPLVDIESSSATDLAHVVAHATEKIVPEKYALIGTSFGADVALW